MEKPYKPEEHELHKMLKEVGLESPSQAFTISVIEKIEATTPSLAQPLVSTRGWIFIVALFAASSLLLYFFPITGVTAAENFLAATERVKQSLPALTISKGTFYAFLFLALFLFQIPFLKRYLERQYR